ncbi:hypothetical protein GWI33_009077 [Rhynchophorus ferrugineus]|uniref:Uncharacterized protein n=1 Tax=Rhynchophorus ferrugineus TaxID=354439 RepID=A0A834IQ40_RHYFE|nr:hypothetical protein GWI33_009077 [Rhynchophorus ferrugineus]
MQMLLISTNNKIDQETTLPTDSNTENMQEESSTDENKQKSILLTCESRVNKRRLSGDSDYAVAKRKLDILFENIMSCCTTTAQLKVLTDTLQSVKPKILALGRGLKECIQVNEIKGKKILMPQRRFIILNNKRLVPLKVVEHSEILKKNG